MKAHIRDQATYQALPALDVVRYLRAQGWREADQLGERASIWVHGSENGEGYEVMVPLEQTLRDYALRMAELFSTLEQVEKRSQLEVLRDVRTTSSDVIRVRLHADQQGHHSLPIDDAVLATMKARELMLAAACAAVEPRAYYHARKFDQATEYVRQLHLGQTEPGSYIYTIFSRVPPSLESQLSFDEEDHDLGAPFERQVSYTLGKALVAAHHAARRAAAQGDMEPFERAISQGVSANLCDALLGLGGGDATEPFEVSLAYAPSRRAPSTMPRRVHFSPDLLPIFEEVSRVFKEKSPRDGFELEGVITRIQQDEREAVHDRSIRIAGHVEGKLCKVDVTLPDDIFPLVLQSFENRRTVRVRGELTQAGSRYTLRNPRGFEVIENDD